jgi:hypothetical protein
MSGSRLDIEDSDPRLGPSEVEGLRARGLQRSAGVETTIPIPIPTPTPILW